jgi:hypothetical protein
MCRLAHERRRSDFYHGSRINCAGRGGGTGGGVLSELARMRRWRRRRRRRRRRRCQAHTSESETKDTVVLLMSRAAFVRIGTLSLSASIVVCFIWRPDAVQTPGPLDFLNFYFTVFFVFTLTAPPFTFISFGLYVGLSLSLSLCTGRVGLDAAPSSAPFVPNF